VRVLLILVIHLLVTSAKLLRPGGLRAVIAESLLLSISCSLAIVGGNERPISRPLTASFSD
jgi:hypothetical protein